MVIYQYSLEEDTLIIRTGHGQFKYKIENAELLKMADQIASKVINELQSIDHGKRSLRDDMGDYAKLMLATLNICEKHITLKNKYEQLNQTVKSMKEVLSNLDPSSHSVTPGRPGQSSPKGYTPVLPSKRTETSKAAKDFPREAITTNANHQQKPYSSGQAAHKTATHIKPAAASTVVTRTQGTPKGIPAAASSANQAPATTSVASATSDAIVKQNIPHPEKTMDIGASIINDKHSSQDKDSSTEPFQSINPSAQYQSEASAKRLLQSGTAALPTHLVPDVPLSPSSTAPLESQEKPGHRPHSNTVTDRLVTNDRQIGSAPSTRTSAANTKECAVPETLVQPNKEEQLEKVVPSRQSEDSVPTSRHNGNERISKQLPHKPYQNSSSSHRPSHGSLPGQAVSPPPTSNFGNQSVPSPTKSEDTNSISESNKAKSTASSVVKRYSATAMEPMINGSKPNKELSVEKALEPSSKLPQAAEWKKGADNEKMALTKEPVAQEPGKEDNLEKQSLTPSPTDKEIVSTPTTVTTDSASFTPAADVIEEEVSEDTPAPPPSYIINTPEQVYNPSLPADTPVYDTGEYLLPQLSFLKNTSSESEIDRKRIRSDAELLEKKLGYFGIKGEVMGISPGPVITTYEYKPDPGIKISKIVNLADDLALALSAYSIRIVAPIPGKDVMGIEIPNIKKSLVPFIDIVTSDAFTQCPSKVPICLGKDIIGNPVVVELESMPHLLIAGATGTGKSVGLNAMITSILYKASPDEVKFLMIDPKRIELSFYNDIPHLLTPVITDMNKANIALQWMVREMDRRYNLLAHFQVRNIEQFNQKLVTSSSPQYDEDGERLEPLPFIVVIIDELADLMMTASRDIEFSLTRLAQMARAAGIHLILATQRPSVDVLTGIIKANFPTRISFQVSSKTDSRTIIDSNGAETLLGNGDMLFVPPGTARLTRVHGTYLSEDELSDITSFIKKQRKPEYIFDVITEQESYETESGSTMDDEYDEKYNEALEVVLTTRQASISSIQRALRVGYNRAARIVDLMEKKGVVGPSDGVRPRKVLTNNMNMM